MTSTITHSNFANGNSAFCRYLDVLAGETYYLLVNNSTTQNVTYTLTWGGTATLLSPFSNPALAPNPFLQPGPQNDGTVPMCNGSQTVNLSSYTSTIINGNANFQVQYYTSPNDAINGTSPVNTPVTAVPGATYYYTIAYTGTTNPPIAAYECKELRTIKFTDASISLNNAVLTECASGNTGQAVFNLTSVSGIMYGGTATVTRKYYPSLADMNAGTNEITNLTNYLSGPATIYVKFTNIYNCTNSATMSLQITPGVTAQNAVLTSCTNAGSQNMGTFNLNSAPTSTDPGVIKSYYPTLQDAQNQTNAIATPTAYIAASSEVFVRVTNAAGCFAIVKITLNVVQFAANPLQDIQVCSGEMAVLDAGPGYETYLWSTGATSQTISVPPGSYWLEVSKSGCSSKFTATVSAFQNPVIAHVEITNNTATVTATGGMPPYQYSINGTTWQASNIISGLPRGEITVFVKDQNDCTPAQTEITVPNLINAITPDGDLINDELDYHELADKKNFSFKIFDRYGKEVYHSEKAKNYKWNGRFQGKAVHTGTYWYLVTWEEPSGETVKYTGWILVKN